MNVGAPAIAADAEGAWAQSTRLAFRLLFAVVGVLALGWAVSNIRRVPPDSRAVVLRFGNVVAEQGAGLLLAWPRPIERVILLPSADRQIQFTVARFNQAPQPIVASPDAPPITVSPTALRDEFTIDRDPRKNLGFVLTGDAGVVHLRATLFYQITDPAAYVVAAQHVGPALERLFVAAAVAVAASRDLDSIMVARTGDASAAGSSASRERLRADLVHAVNRRLDQLAAEGAGLGVTVSRVDIATVLPAGAKAAFDRILTVTQTADQTIARARTYAAATALSATQEAHRILTEAQALATERVSQAQTRAAPILALAAQAEGPAGQSLVDRMYYDRIGTLLRKAKEVDTVDPHGGARLLLPGPSMTPPPTPALAAPGPGK
ncbi:MAG: protease modulator HflK [Alphaproteobacteria bacterium]|nr:protease modulator HflK [Alphaproteobacteria bacterium]